MWRQTWLEREKNGLFNDALNTFYLQLCGVRHIILIVRKEGSVLLTTHSTHFIYGYVASDKWLEREKCFI